MCWGVPSTFCQTIYNSTLVFTPVQTLNVRGVNLETSQVFRGHVLSLVDSQDYAGAFQIPWWSFHSQVFLLVYFWPQLAGPSQAAMIKQLHLIVFNKC